MATLPFLKRKYAIAAAATLNEYLHMTSFKSKTPCQNQPGFVV